MFLSHFVIPRLYKQTKLLLQEQKILICMKIAFIVFDGITWLDFIGVYDPISRLKSMNYLPALSWDVCSYSEIVKDGFGVTMKPDKVKPSLSGYDALIIPGGFGTRKLQFDEDFISWIKKAELSEYKISVCTGSLILGAAGFLQGKNATTNHLEYAALMPYCKQVLKDRIVEDGNVITAGTVSASLDLGLYLCKKWAGEKSEIEIRKRMGYLG